MKIIISPFGRTPYTALLEHMFQKSLKITPCGRDFCYARQFLSKLNCPRLSQKFESLKVCNFATSQVRKYHLRITCVDNFILGLNLSIRNKTTNSQKR